MRSRQTLRERAPAHLREQLAEVEARHGAAEAERMFAAWLDSLQGATWTLSDAVRELADESRAALTAGMLFLGKLATVCAEGFFLIAAAYCLWAIFR